MKLRLSSSVLAIVCAVVLPGIMATTAAPGVLAQSEVEPIARINPDRPVQIKVVNPSGAPIACRLTQPVTEERTVAPGGTVTFGSTTTSYLPLPIYFLAYPQASDIGLSLDVSASNNVVTVVVGAGLSNIPGYTTVSIDGAGGVYVY